MTILTYVSISGKARAYLWKFLYNLLELDTKRQLIEWRCKNLLEFQIKQPKETARLWGLIKNKRNFVYSELARGIRYYYGKGVIEKVRECMVLFMVMFRHN